MRKIGYTISSMIYEPIAYTAMGLAASMAPIMAVRLRAIFRATKPPKYTTPLGDETDLPSVTVCIPARNEQHALTDCLERVLASTYQKLEIIVLDDVSGDDTSALIKSFASSGVRFIQGDPLPQEWLGKNHALEELLREANGTYILFMDVDTRVEPQAIERIIRYAVSHTIDMVSVLPFRNDGWRGSVLASPLRFFWSLLFHSPTLPAVSSGSWCIRRSTLETEFNGFTKLHAAIQPEVTIARELMKKQRYHLLVSTAEFGVNYEKKWRSQLLTSIRLLYPIARYSIANVLLIAFDIAILLSPWIVLVYGIFQGLLIVSSIAGAVCVAYMTVYGYYAATMWRKGAFLGALLWPLLLLQELVLVIASGVQYKRKSVTWKGRLVRPAK
ncbi:TPA: hypothetical protein DD425_03270 [Candidatus Saccharibacteria bacterium]|nr:hypothetical protein [Candidatus Saccharibacteria bacterium]